MVAGDGGHRPDREFGREIGMAGGDMVAPPGEPSTIYGVGVRWGCRRTARCSPPVSAPDLSVADPAGLSAPL